MGSPRTGTRRGGSAGRRRGHNAIWYSPRPFAPRIIEDLGKAGHRVGQKRVARLMRREGLQGMSTRRGRPRPWREIPEAPPAPGLVNRAFTGTAPNQRWVADLVYIPTMASFHYFAIVLGVFSRPIVGWCVRVTLHARVVLEALEMAATRTAEDATAATLHMAAK